VKENFYITGKNWEKLWLRNYDQTGMNGSDLGINTRVDVICGGCGEEKCAKIRV
jgi:hypothetical protein